MHNRLRRRRQQSDVTNRNSWLTTYSDMVTLLLCFFVMLFAFSNLDIQKFQEIIGSLQGAFGILDGGAKVLPTEGVLYSPSLTEDYDKLLLDIGTVTEMYDKLQAFIETENLTGSVVLEIEERGIIIRFSDRILFDLGEAQLKPAFVATLDKFIEAIRSWEHPIRVEGHTDYLPINNERFPSNWELSTARASIVVRYFIDKGIDPLQISAAGYGEYRPIADNSTLEGRARNRRVDVVLVRHQYTMEPNPKLPMDPIIKEGEVSIEAISY
jgi:chemotaxis protein MotB